MNKFYNSRFPEVFRENYNDERDYYWKKLQNHLDEGFTRETFPKFMNSLSICMVKLLVIFDINKE